MKKGLLLALILIIISPFLTACGQTSTCQNVNTEVASFMSNEKYKKFLTIQHTYSTIIENAKNNASSQFAVIEMYEQIASLELVLINENYSAFLVNPLKNNNKEGTLCGDIITKLNSVENSYEDFETEKQTFINIINITNSTTNNIAINALTNFEKSFGKFVNKLNSLNVSFTKAYSTLYGGILDNASESQQVKNASIQVYTELLNAYVKYSIVEYNYVYTTASVNYFNSLYSLKTNILTKTENTANYSNWLTCYKSLKGELSQFNTSLNKVNLTKNYTNPSTKTQIYLTKINDFVTTNATWFINQTNNLIYN